MDFHQPKNIYVASLSPPIIATNRFGIDIPNTDRLIAKPSLGSVSTTVGQVLGLDGNVVYQDLKTLKNGLRKLSKTGVADFEDSVFREN